MGDRRRGLPTAIVSTASESDVHPDRFGGRSERRLAHGIGGDDDPPGARGREAGSERQDPRHAPDLAGERELTKERPDTLGTSLLGSQQDRNRDRQVEGGAGLSHFRGGQIHGDPASRILETAVPDRATDSLPGL